jgi:hypothetical protein
MEHQDPIQFFNYNISRWWWGSGSQGAATGAGNPEVQVEVEHDNLQVHSWRYRKYPTVSPPQGNNGGTGLAWS